MLTTPIQKRRLLLWLSAAAFLLAAGWFWIEGRGPLVSGTSPDRLSDQEFWTLSSSFSEPDGTFHSENLVSNEIRFQAIVPELSRTVPHGRAYVGVGSEQNFTYIAAIDPAIAFIVDIRRGNLDLHLIYKAIFEMSATRAEFVSKVFSRPQPAGLNAASTTNQIFAAYESVPLDQHLYEENLRSIQDQLSRRHGFALSAEDLSGIEFVYRSWATAGPDIHYELNTNGFGRGRGGNFPTYAELMTATDAAGVNQSYLGSEASFLRLKQLESRNLIVPVVGNFAGPKALRAVAAYLQTHGAIVSAFYASNVEQYLQQDGIWNDFCRNAARMPVDASSRFIRSQRGGFAGQRPDATGFSLRLVPMQSEFRWCGLR